MRRRLFAVMTLFPLALASCTSDAPETESEWRTLGGQPPLVIAHRGASGYLPEHTIEAYALAIEQGADIIEPDLVVTQDGHLIARHDRHLSTTTNVADKPEFADRKRIDPDPNGDGLEDWWVEDFTLEEIKTLRARQPRANRPQEFNDQYEIPTFEDVLALAAQESDARDRPVGVYPETKHPGFFASVGLNFEAPLLAALEGFDAGPVFIQSFEAEILKQLNGKTTAKLVQLVYEEKPLAGPNIPLTEISEYADGVGPSKTILIHCPNHGKKYVETAHSLGLFVHPWTFRADEPVLFGDESKDKDPAKFLEFFAIWARETDGLFTDHPDVTVKALENFARGSTKYSYDIRPCLLESDIRKTD